MKKETTKQKISSPKKATQNFVPVSEVRDGVIVLKDGSMRSVLMASSLNFALKSEDEQTAFILQFQNFLNSLDFPVQMFIQSRKLDIRPYLGTLEESFKNQLDDLMRIQIREYVEFVRSFTEAANIMTKNFFVIVPYSPAILDVKTNILAKLPWKKQTIDANSKNRTFEENVSQLEQRVGVVQQGLIRTGVRTVQLGTEETVELLYKIFNPGEQDKPAHILKEQ